MTLSVHRLPRAMLTPSTSEWKFDLGGEKTGTVWAPKLYNERENATTKNISDMYELFHAVG